MTAVNRSGSALEFASETLKADKEVVMAAVQEKGSVGYALEYASETLKADKEVVMAAVQQNSSYAGKKAVQKYASDDLKADPEILRNINDSKTHRGKFDPSNPNLMSCQEAGLRTF